jgi:hypothetical protein
VIVHVIASESLQRATFVDVLASEGFEPLVVLPAAAHATLSEVRQEGYYLIDADALDVVEAFLRAPVQIAERSVLVCSAEAAMVSKVQAASARGVLGFYVKPYDLTAVVARFTRSEALVRISDRPPAHAGDNARSRVPSAPPSMRSLPPPGIRDSSPPPSPSSPPSSIPPQPSSTPERLPSSPARRDSVGPAAPVTSLSEELAGFLREAESRAQKHDEDEGLFLSAEDEVETVLPRDVLAALEHSIGDEDDDAGYETIHGPLPGGKTTDGSYDANTTGTGRDSAPSVPPSQTSSASPLSAGTDWGTGTASAPPLEVSERRETERAEALGQRAAKSASVQRIITNRRDTLMLLGEAIAAHSSAVITFESESASRDVSRILRVTLSQGDVVSVVSSAEADSLAEFMIERGDILRGDAAAIQKRIPREPRYAAAAFVAHGVLHNDELWDVLHAHAEWLLAKLFQLDRASATQESAISQRGAPSVFGASTGAAAFIECVRRSVPAREALAELGGARASIAEGPNATLLRECGLDAGLELATLYGRSLSEIADAELHVVLYALSLLKVVHVVHAPEREGERGSVLPREQEDGLDDEAKRQRIRARASIVDEGDYFALLGVPMDATGYEIRKSFLALRKEFEPSRMLTARTLDLKDDVLRIVDVLEEAYEILRDDVRRNRYRNAIRAASMGA